MTIRWMNSDDAFCLICFWRWDRLKMSKAVVVGDLNVGKTCLINRHRMTVCSTVSVCQLEVTVNLTLLFLTQKCPSQPFYFMKEKGAVVSIFSRAIYIHTDTDWFTCIFLPSGFVKMHLTGITKQPSGWTLKSRGLSYAGFHSLSRCKDTFQCGFWNFYTSTALISKWLPVLSIHWSVLLLSQ